MFDKAFANVRYIWLEGYLWLTGRRITTMTMDTLTVGECDLSQECNLIPGTSSIHSTQRNALRIMFAKFQAGIVSV